MQSRERGCPIVQNAETLQKEKKEKNCQMTLSPLMLSHLRRGEGEQLSLFEILVISVSTEEILIYPFLSISY